MSFGSLSTWLKLLLTLAVSVFFLFLFVRDLNLRAVWNDILDADYKLVPLALALFAASLVARACRWRVFYRPHPPSFGVLFSMLLITYAGNNLLPLRGGELLRAQLLLQRAGVSRMRTFGVALVERFFDLLVMGIFVIAGRFLVDTGPAFFGTGLLIAIAAGAGLLITRVIAEHHGLPGRLAAIRWLPLKDPWRIKLRFWGEWIVEGFSVMRSAPAFLEAVLWTAVAWALEFSMYWLVARAFHIDASFLTIAFVGASANLALSIPSAQGGVGPFQLVAKEALLKFSIATNVAAAYALALHMLIIVPVTVAGMVVFFSLMPRRHAASLSTIEDESSV